MSFLKAGMLRLQVELKRNEALDALGIFVEFGNLSFILCELRLWPF